MAAVIDGADPAPCPLPEVGPEVAHHLRSAGVPPDELCAWLWAQDRLHRERHHAPLVHFRLEDPTLLDDRDRALSLWQLLIEARARGELSALRLALDRVKPRPAPPLWFARAARAGVSELVLDLGAAQVNQQFSLLAEVCTRAHEHEIMPSIPLPLVGPDFDLGESVMRAVVILKGALPWQPVPAQLPDERWSELRAELGPALSATVAQGSANAVLLLDLVLGPWLQRLPPSDRRALFPVWLAAYSGEGRDEALAGVHPYLAPAVTAWLNAPRTAVQSS